MGKYVVKRLVHGLISVVIVIIVVMLLVYGLMNREQIFAEDQNYTRTALNEREVYKYQRWEEFGYVDYVPYSDYLSDLVRSGELDSATRDEVVQIARKAENDEANVAEYVEKFTQYYESQGYTVKRLDAKMDGRKVKTGGRQQLYAYRDRPLLTRAFTYFLSVFKVDNIHSVKDDVGERGLTFTWYDPVYGGEKFSPAIIGNGTQHKYLMYFDSNFPFFQQNFLTIQLGNLIP